MSEKIIIKCVECTMEHITFVEADVMGQDGQLEKHFVQATNKFAYNKITCETFQRRFGEGWP